MTAGKEGSCPGQVITNTGFPATHSVTCVVKSGGSFQNFIKADSLGSFVCSHLVGPCNQSHSLSFSPPLSQQWWFFMHLVGEMHQNFLRDLNDLKSAFHLLDSGGPCCQRHLSGSWHRPDSPGLAASCWSGCSRGTMWWKGAPLHPSLLASWYGIGNAKYKPSTVNRERGGSVNSKWYCPSLLLEFDYVLILPLRYVALTMRFALVGRSCDSEVLYALFYPWSGGTEHLGKIQFESDHSQEFVCF